MFDGKKLAFLVEREAKRIQTTEHEPPVTKVLKRIGINTSTYYSMSRGPKNNGRPNPTFNNVEKVCRYFQLDISFFSTVPEKITFN